MASRIFQSLMGEGLVWIVMTNCLLKIGSRQVKRSHEWEIIYLVNLQTQLFFNVKMAFSCYWNRVPSTIFYCATFPSVYTVHWRYKIDKTMESGVGFAILLEISFSSLCHIESKDGKKTKPGVNYWSDTQGLIFMCSLILALGFLG